MNRFYYSSSINTFLEKSEEEILGVLSKNNEFNTEITQKAAWLKQIDILKGCLFGLEGTIYFEFSIPRMGRRVDTILIIGGIIFVVEFKIGEKEYLASSIDQVWDYALDLKNFHETSHENLIAPILVSTEAAYMLTQLALTPQNDNLLYPVKANASSLREIIIAILSFQEGSKIDVNEWEKGRYSPTPTIIEAAMAMFNKHSVSEISRSDASAKNLKETSHEISGIIERASKNGEKAICFVTGVPGAGKTLVGLDIATKHLDSKKQLTSVFLSGNGPLVDILREALTRDKVKREKKRGNKVTKAEVRREVKMFIQNVHHYRDAYLADKTNPPIDHIAIFDEAQRAWDKAQTSSFMARKKGNSNFLYSEPEFLISCLDRHKDWAVIVCLVGGGQEINIGEAGISEWIDSINRSFPSWKVHISPNLTDSEYAAGRALERLSSNKNVLREDKLHLSVSMRSFRAEHVSLLVKNLLDIDINGAKNNYLSIKKKYPIAITRSLAKAKAWLKENARGSERYGIVVSSQAQRLKPYAIDVKSPIKPIHWFLDGKEDIRSSYYLEDVATEFQVQGLELDWSCVTWDADFRFGGGEWKNYSFKGSKWQRIIKEERKLYLKNAYRVLLTRARQGFVIVVPEGDDNDHTRLPEFYNDTFNYLAQIGFTTLD